MGKVSIVKIKSGIKTELNKALDLIGGIKNFVSENDRVMLKPNINGMECTDINLVESLIQILFDNNVKHVFIAEATFGNKHITGKFFDETGYRELAKKYNINLVNLNASNAKNVKVKSPLKMNELRIAEEVFEADKIINIPVMKVHYATGVTLALKNLKGVLAVGEKRKFHETGLDDCIVDLCNTVKTHLNIVDCISCMEKMGPRGGDIVKLNTIIAGGNIADVDYIGTKIMNFTLDEAKHVKKYIGINEIEVEKIETLGEQIENVKYNFKRAEMADILPENVKLYNNDACSSCMNALLLSFFVMENKPEKSFDFALGTLDENIFNSENFKIAFGNCCKKDVRFDGVIKGCPPYPFDLGKLLKEKNIN